MRSFSSTLGSALCPFSPQEPQQYCTVQNLQRSGERAFFPLFRFCTLSSDSELPSASVNNASREYRCIIKRNEKPTRWEHHTLSVIGQDSKDTYLPWYIFCVFCIPKTDSQPGARGRTVFPRKNSGGQSDESSTELPYNSWARKQAVENFFGSHPSRVTVNVLYQHTIRKG